MYTYIWGDGPSPKWYGGMDIREYTDIYTLYTPPHTHVLHNYTYMFTYIHMCVYIYIYIHPCAHFLHIDTHV